jgi:hypothetical protein
MPEIARFDGLTVVMYHHDHEPAHVHCYSGGHHVTARIGSGLITGTLPRRQRQRLLARMAVRRAELRENWIRARAGWPLNPVAPPE